MNAAVAHKPYEVPNGGLASFLTATTGDWSDEALNGLDYEVIRPTADQLAGFGREGDNRIAHVADGETVIPMEVFEEDPALKEALFGRMREMGIEPERYVVGNELNSINPVTGQPEFFLKKLFKGVKKAVKGVVKVFKKVAPLVLSVGLNFLFPGLGAIAAGALGSGIGTLVQGGNLKDAFKAALIGGAVGGISSGIGSVMKGGDFMSGVKGALPGGAPGAPAPIEKGVPDFVAPEAAGPEIMPPQNVAEAAGGVPTNLDMSPIPGAKEAQLAKAPLTAEQALSPEVAEQSAEALKTATEETAKGAADKGIIEKAFDFVKGASDPTTAEIFSSAEYKELIANGFSPAEAFAEAQKQLAPGILAKYGPMAAVGLGAMGLAGGFKSRQPEPFDFFGGQTGFDLLAQFPERYAIAQPGSNYAQAMGLPPGGAANGGDISHFPRRNGAIRGPGTETSDDIPAMLSDGEFVMTARAVRGAGNGSRQDGMRKMYDMMRTFEGRASRG